MTRADGRFEDQRYTDEALTEADPEPYRPTNDVIRDLADYPPRQPPART